MFNKREKREKRTKPIFFVCAAISPDNELQTKSIQALNLDEAVELFYNQFGCKPKDVYGPFHKKKTQVLVNTTELIFSTVYKTAEYNGWIVSANILKKPTDHAHLLFKRRIDGQSVPKPQGIVVVPIYDLRLLNAE